MFYSVRLSLSRLQLTIFFSAAERAWLPFPSPRTNHVSITCQSHARNCVCAQNANRKTTDLVQVIFEFVLYFIIIVYLTKASDEIAKHGSFSGYITNFWNLVDIMNVFSFIFVIALRVFWMINSSQIEYHVGDEYDASEIDNENYIPIRLSMVYFSWGRTFFAFGVLLSFIKSFRFVGVSRRLNLFCSTIQEATKSMGLLMLIYILIVVAFAVSFHMAFGQFHPSYRDFPTSIISLFMLSLGEFDAGSLREVSPALGMFLFSSYAVVMIFIVLTMMLKIVDVAYEDMRAVVINVEGAKQENFPIQVKLAFRKIIFDIYWSFKVKATLKSAKLTESAIEKLKKDGKGLQDALKRQVRSGEMAT